MTKQIIGSIPKCYSVLGVIEDGQPKLIFAGEGDGLLSVFSGENYAHEETVWEGGGGTMSVVPFSEHAFLASRGFYSMVEAQQSNIELVRHTPQGYTHSVLAMLPYLHRFGVVKLADGSRFIVAATIADFKADKEDWSHPGHLYRALLPDEPNELLHWVRVDGDYTQNHGFFVDHDAEGDTVYICSREGVFRILAPADKAGGWRVEQVMNQPASDLAVMDIDGDGLKELAILEPFHGNAMVVYHPADGCYREAFRYPVAQDFYHAIIPAELNSEKVFLGGARKGPMQLFAVAYRDGAYTSFVLDQDVGPSNLAMLHLPDCDMVLSANRQIHQAAVYRFEKAGAR